MMLLASRSSDRHGHEHGDEHVHVFVIAVRQEWTKAIVSESLNK